MNDIEYINWFVSYYNLDRPTSNKETRSNCPMCAGKHTLSYNTQDLTFVCFRCGWKGNIKNEYKNINGNTSRIDLTDEENLIYQYRKKTGKNYRLSDYVIKAFEIKPKWYFNKTKTKKYNALTLFDDNRKPLKQLINGKWIFVPEENGREKDFQKFYYYIKNNKTKKTFVLAGEWDMFAFAELFGNDYNIISPVGGEGKKKYKKEDLNIFDNKDIYILFDNDKTGRGGAESLADQIQKTQKIENIRIVDLSLIVGGGGDIDDYVNLSGISKDDIKNKLLELCEKTEPLKFNIILQNSVPALNGRKIKKFDCSYSYDLAFSQEVNNIIYTSLSLSPAKQMLVFSQIAEHYLSDELQKHKWVNLLKQEAETIKAIKIREEIEERIKNLKIKKIKKTFAGESDLFYYYDDENKYYKLVDTEEVSTLSYQLAKKIQNLADIKKIRETANEIKYILENELKLTAETKEKTEKYINFKNGLLNLETLELEDHNPEVFIDFLMGVEYPEEEVRPTNFLIALDDWFSPETKKEFIKMVYYLLSGNRSLNKAFILIGDGKNGKSEIQTLLKNIVGEDNTSYIGLEKLDDANFLSKLQNKKLNLVDEVPKSSMISDAIFKRITGGQPIEVKVLYENPITITPKALFVIATNQYLRTNDNSLGMDRRLVYLPVKKINDNKKIDNFFEKKLKPELGQIIKFCLVKGKELFEAEGFIETNEIEKQKEQAKELNSVSNYFYKSFIGDFVYSAVDKIRAGEDWRIQSSRYLRSKPFWFFKDFFGGKENYYFEPIEHYESYVEHCRQNGFKAVSSAVFRQDIKVLMEQLFFDKFFKNFSIRLSNARVVFSFMNPDGLTQSKKRIRTNIIESDYGLNFEEELLKFFKKFIEVVKIDTEDKKEKIEKKFLEYYEDPFK